MLDDIQGNHQIQLIKLYKKTTRKIYNLWQEKEETSINLVMYLERNFIFFLSKFNLLTIAICSMNSISLICNNVVGHQHNHS